MAKQPDERIPVEQQIRAEGYFALKHPNKKARNGSFVMQQVLPDGTTPELDLKEIDILNERYRKGLITLEEGIKQGQALRARLYELRDRGKRKLKFTEDNLKVLNQYWEDEYGTRKARLVEQGTSMWYDLKRAVGECQGISLMVCSYEELQEHLDEALADEPEKHGRVCSRLNSLLSYLGRGFTLDKLPEGMREVRFLSPSDFALILPHLDEFQQVLCRLAFYSGLRVGEIFGLQPHDLKREGFLYVARQMDYKGVVRLPKTRKTRNVLFLGKDGKAAFEAWCQIPKEVRLARRATGHSEKVKRACLKAGVLECRFHDLRHSYAVEALAKGLSITQTAKLLGNSVAVCEKYYTGFAATSSEMAAIMKILEAG